jgi:hypothetical protein
MATEPMPTALRNTTRAYISEIIANLGDVLRFTYDDRARDWRRMTGYRLTDAEDTAGLLADIYAARHAEDGLERRTVESYLQVSNQETRSARPSLWARAAVADMDGGQRPAGSEREVVLPSHRAEPGDPRNMQTEAVLTALQATLHADTAFLEHLDDDTRAMAVRVMDALQGAPVPA